MRRRRTLATTLSIVISCSALVLGACGGSSSPSASPSAQAAEQSSQPATPTPTPPGYTPPAETPTPTATQIPSGQPGSLVWEVDGPEDWYAWPAASEDGKTVYFGSGRNYNDDPAPDPGALTSVDASTGDVKWRFETPARAFWPVEHDGTVFIGTRDGTVFAVDAATGRERWRHMTGGVPVVVLANDDGVFAGDGDPETYGPGGLDGPTGWAGRAWAFDPGTGWLRWQFETGGDIAYLEQSPGMVLVTSSASRDDISESIWALDPATGDILWQAHVRHVTSPPVVAGDLLIVPSEVLQAHRVSDGMAVWGQEVPDGGGWYHPATDGKNVFTASNTHDIAMFEAATGTPVWMTDYCDCSFLASIDDRQYALYHGWLIVAPPGEATDTLPRDEFWGLDLGGAGWSRPVLLEDVVVIGGLGGLLAFKR